MSVIKFTKTDEDVTPKECSFCKGPLVKGKHLAAEGTTKAICFACVKRCDELIKRGETNEQI